MDAFDFFLPTPVDEMYEDGVSCVECGKHLPQEAFWDGEGAFYCEPCWRPLVEEIEKEAKAYAKEHCKVTRQPPEYDPDLEYRCPPEEYTLGSRESYTPNAFMACCRHHYTNYDELIKPLERDSVRDRIYYRAIRDRITDLLEDTIALFFD